MTTQKNFIKKIADLFRRKPKLAVELAPLSYSHSKRTYKKNTSNRRSMEDKRKKTMELRRRRSRESRIRSRARSSRK